MQDSVQDGQVLVRRDHINAVRLDPGAVLDLADLHGGNALEQFRQDALVRRVQVLDDDKGHAAAHRHIFQEQFQDLQPPGGSADADDGEWAAARAARVVRLRGRRLSGDCSGRLMLPAGGLGWLFHGFVLSSQFTLHTVAEKPARLEFRDGLEIGLSVPAHKPF